MASTTDVGCSNKLFVRHCMKSKFIAGLKEILNDKQKAMISKTPFKWFLEVNDDIKLGRNIVSELLQRWDDERGGFSFGEKFVELNELDVTLSLGLGLVDEQINLDDKTLGKSDCRKHFAKGNGKYELQVIYEFIMKKHKKLSSVDICRLYILVGISELLLPNRTKTVFPILFEKVDKIGELGRFCWGRMVYQYLVSSLSKGCTAWNGGKGARTVYVEGCVYVLQVWFCDRFVLSNNLVHKYPRILHWMDVNVGDNVIKSALERGVMLDDYGASMTEMREPFVKASFNPELEEERKIAQKKEMNGALDGVLQEQEVEIQALEEELAALKTELAEEKKTYNGCYSTPCNQHEKSNNFGHEGQYSNNLGQDGQDCSNENVMKHYMRRKRFRSAVCKTPYTGYSPKL